MTGTAVQESQAAPTVFFTPGCWHEPWVFDDLRGILSERGFETASAPLASSGAARASVGLFDDAAGIRAAILKLVELGKEVVLVAHSYGGIVTSNSVEGLSVKQRADGGKKGGVILILYMAAFVVSTGKSLAEALGGVRPSWWIDGFVTVDDPTKVFYHDVDTTLAAKAAAGLKKSPLRVVRDKSAYAPWTEGFEVGYIFAEHDQALDISLQKGMFAEFPVASFSATLAASHSPFFSMPGPLADVIQNAAEHVFSKRAGT